MLRRTAARAFGSGGDEGRPSGPAVPDSRRGEAVDLLFSGLLEGIEACLRRGYPGAAAEPGAGDGSSPVWVSKPRPLAEGLEFALEGPGGCWRFLNTLRGFLLVTAVADGSLRGRELLSVEWQRDGYRPIRKPLAGGGAIASPPRPAFRYTSVPELAREYVAAVLGGRTS